MAAHPPSPGAARRARRGSIERPVNARLYRGTWLLVGIPMLIAAFSVTKPAGLRPAEPALPPQFDRVRATALATELAHLYPDRRPGTRGHAGAERWFASQLAPYGFRVRSDAFTATIAGRGRVRLVNLLAVVPGRSPQSLVVMAHLDDAGTGPGANDDASGIAALLEVARSYGATSVTAPVAPGEPGERSG